MVSMSRAWTTGWSARFSAISSAPRSRISRAVIVLPSASLGSETLNNPTRKSEICRAVAASLAIFVAWIRSRAAKPANSSTADATKVTPILCRRANFRAR